MKLFLEIVVIGGAALVFLAITVAVLFLRQIKKSGWNQ